MAVGYLVDQKQQKVHLSSYYITLYAQQLSPSCRECYIRSLYHVWVGILLETSYLMGTRWWGCCSVFSNRFALREISRVQRSPLQLFWNISRLHFHSLLLSSGKIPTKVLDDRNNGRLYGFYAGWIQHFCTCTFVWIYIWYSSRRCSLSQSNGTRTEPFIRQDFQRYSIWKHNSICYFSISTMRWDWINKKWFLRMIIDSLYN